MEFIEDPAERTTAATDAALAVVALGGIGFLGWSSADDGHFLKMGIWSSAFGLIGLASTLGAAAHGLVISNKVHNRLWQVLNACLALAVSLFAAGVVYDVWGSVACQRVLPFLIAAGLIFYAATLVSPGYFLIFIIYEGLALIFALTAYVFMMFTRELPGASLMAAGILASILAAALQACKSLTVTVIWKFDHNGIFHVVQIIGVVLLIIGLRQSVMG
jgi:hypothetical protein